MDGIFIYFFWWYKNLFLKWRKFKNKSCIEIKNSNEKIINYKWIRMVEGGEDWKIFLDK